MEQAIRQLLSRAEKGGDETLLNEAFQKLKQGRRDGSQIDPFTSDLYVICAQIAVKLNAHDTATQCMKLYFQKTPPNNEYLCLAYLCQAQLFAPTDSSEVDQLEQCVCHVLKAVNFAKSNQRYYYLVFNASVLYWSFVRPFLKPNARHYIVRSFQAVVKALEDVDDDDYEWRAELLVSLLECLIDAGRREEALSLSLSAFDFTKTYVPHACKQVLALQVKYKLVEPAKLQNSVKSTTELAIYYHMLKLSNSESTANVNNDATTILNAICADNSDSQDSLLRRGSVLMQPLGFSERGALLLDLTRICFQLDCIDVAEKCVSYLSSYQFSEKVSLQTNFLKCELKVCKLSDTEKFTKHSIDVRLQAISSLEEHLVSARRSGDESLIQMGCVTIWNLSLPLLQTNLRKSICSHLSAAVGMLDEIDSLLLSLRCQLHFEVAKCEEDKEQLQSAILHLMKALELDDVGSYKPQIKHTLERVKLKAVLYQTPERVEDHAAMIIEQAESAKDASTPAMMREYLMKVGILLSPDAFHLAMEGEEALPGAKVGQSSVQKLAEKVLKYETGIAKLQGHVERLEGTDDRERVMLWADLVKTARRQKVWDVTRVAAMFCLLYDDNRWAVKALDQSPAKSAENKSNNVTPISSSVEFGVISKEHLEGEAKFHENEDFLRLFAEINFVYAEALVELILREGFKFLEKVKAPEETKLTPSIFQRENVPTSDTNEWLQYTNWMEGISRKAMDGFLRASSIGVELSQSWIVCNAGIYVWNYAHHLLAEGSYATLKPHLHALFTAMRTCGHGEQTVFLCDLAHAVARGFMQVYIPEDFFKPVKRIENMARGTGLGGATSPTKGRSTKLSNKNIIGKNSETTGADVMMNNLKEAHEILEYALAVTSGSVINDIVPIDIRYPLIKAIVLCKGLMNQQLPKNYGHDGEDKESQGPMSRALFVLEALLLQTKGIVEFQQCPSLSDTIKMVQAAKWTDNVLLLQVWSHLSVLSFHLEDGATALYCSDMALELKSLEGANTKKSTKKRTGINYGNNFTLEQEMLYYASVIKGQCLVATMNGRLETRKLALKCFVDACQYGSLANDYQHVMSSARHIWNIIHPLIKNPLERQVLKKPIKKVLAFIQDVAKNHKGVEVVEEKEEEHKSVKKSTSAKTAKSQKSKTKVEKVSKSNSKVSTIPSPVQPGEFPVVEEKGNSLDEDLSLRAALYGVLFQAYADKGELTEGVAAMDAAIKVMPRTHHRLLIFKHRVMTNAKLNKPIQFDMGKFCDESESLLAQMWHRVANSSVKSEDQMTGYINAIQALSDSANLLQKVQYMGEFAEWLFVNEYNVSEALDQFLHAVNLLIDSPTVISHVSSISATKDKGSFFDSLKDIKTMDVLMRLYVMIASMVGHAHALFRQCSLSATLVVENMWKRAILNADAAVKAGLKPGEVAKPKSREGKSGSPDHLKLDGSPSKFSRKSATSQTFGSKASTKSPIPSNLEGWANFTLSKNIKEHFKADITGAYLSATSITKPELSLFYLEVLSNNLYSIGLHHHAIVPMQLMNYIADDIMNSRSATTLINMRFCDLYEKLKLKVPYQNHQKCIGTQILSEEDLALSRENCEIWKERKQKVKLFEGCKLSAATEVRTMSSANKLLKPEVVPCQQHTGYADEKHVWCKMAGYLIQWTQYQTARVLLEEAKLCADAYDDEFTKEIISYHYASIAYQERDWGQVLLLIEGTNFRPKSQLLWMKKLLLLAETSHNLTSQSKTFQFISSNRGFAHAKAVLQDGMKTIQEMHTTNENKINLGSYIHAKLQHKMGVLCLKESKEKRNDTAVQLSLLTDADVALKESYQQLLQSGYVLESVAVMRESVDIQMRLASNEVGDGHKELLLKAFDICKSALSTVSSLIFEITEITTSEDVGGMHLPAHQELNACQLKQMEVMLVILDVALNEKKAKTKKEEEKKLINRVIDNFVDMEQKLSPIQTKWNHIVDVISQDVLAMCSFINSFKKQQPRFAMEASVNLGQLLRNVARYDMADEFDAWLPTEHFLEGADEQHKFLDTRSNEMDGDYNEKQDKLPFSSLSEKISKFQSYAICTSQAVECLLHAIDMSLHNENLSVLSSATLNLLEIAGKRDLALAVNILALYQSVQASNFMRQVAAQTFVDPHTSRSSAAFLQNEILTQEGLVEWTASLEASNTLLDGYEWWKQLSVSKHALELLKEAPSHVTFVVLQHSADRKFLYAAVMERSSLEPPVKRSTKSPTPTSRTAIQRKETDEALLDNLLDMGRDYNALVCREYMMEAKEDSESERRKLLQESQESEKLQQAHIKADRRQRMAESFETLVAATEAYLGSLLKTVEEGMKSASMAESVVILADHLLMELPLEALGVFQLEGIKSVSRDFSLQIFLNRYHQEYGENEKHVGGKASVVAGGRRESKAAKPAEKGPAKKNGKGDGGGEKKAGGARDVDNFVVDILNLKYLIDPFNDGSRMWNMNTDIVEEVISVHKHKISKWGGIKGALGVANVKDMQELMESSEAFLFSGFGKFLSIVPPECIASLNMSNCNVFILLDLVQTSEIFSRQGSHDSQKTWSRLQLENPVETAAILTLSGVKSLAMNNWHTTLATNNEKLHHVIDGLCEKLVTLGESVTSWSVLRTTTKAAEPVDDSSMGVDQSKKGKGGVGAKEEDAAVAGEVQCEVVVNDDRVICDRFGFVLYGIPNALVNG